MIINPENGPGEGIFPSDEYRAQIQNLAVFSNVKTVGYVRTGYANRDIDDVLRDISTYAGWETEESSFVNTTALGMHGIFIDEASYEFSAEAAEYMRTISRATKEEDGILEPRTVSHPQHCFPASCLSLCWRTRVHNSRVD